MTNFVGFTAYDFDYFVSPDDQYKPILKTKLQAFGGAVYARLPGELRIIYNEGPDLGQFKAGSGRGGVLRLRKEQTGNAFDHCNFTIEINESGLSFNAVIRDGKATDLRKPIGALSQLLINTPDVLLAYLRSLGMHYTFRISSREGAGAKRLMPGNEMWHLKYAQTLDPVVDETVPVLSSLLIKIPFPGVHLRREFPRSAVLTKTGEELVADAVAAISALFPILYLVEHGKLPAERHRRKSR
jgi:hypothetical protein